MLAPDSRIASRPVRASTPAIGDTSSGAEPRTMARDGMDLVSLPSSGECSTMTLLLIDRPVPRSGAGLTAGRSRRCTTDGSYITAVDTGQGTGSDVDMERASRSGILSGALRSQAWPVFNGLPKPHGNGPATPIIRAVLPVLSGSPLTRGRGTGCPHHP